MTFQVEADEVAGAQLVGRQADDGDGLCMVERALDRERVLIPGEIEYRVACRTHDVATPLAVTAAARANPCSRSQIRSSTCSMPTDSLMVPGPTPAAFSSASLNCRCVVLAGWMIRLFTSPTLARCDQTV